MISRTHNIDWATFSSVFSPEGVYMICYGAIYGMTLWVSFVGGIVALKALPRAEFRNLQARSFPVYFGISLALSTVMLSAWTWTHPDVFSLFIFRPLVPDILQAWMLAIVVASSAANYFYIGPQTTSIMFKRAKLEKAEGKPYDAPDASDTLKELSLKFMQLHHISTLVNSATLLALTFHGLWIGTYTPHGY